MNLITAFCKCNCGVNSLLFESSWHHYIPWDVYKQLFLPLQIFILVGKILLFMLLMLLDCSNSLRNSFIIEVSVSRDILYKNWNNIFSWKDKITHYFQTSFLVHTVFTWKKQCVYCNLYVWQNLHMSCSLNFEFGTYSVIQCIFIFFNVNKVTQHDNLGPPWSDSVVVPIRSLTISMDSLQHWIPNIKFRKLPCWRFISLEQCYIILPLSPHPFLRIWPTPQGTKPNSSHLKKTISIATISPIT